MNERESSFLPLGWSNSDDVFRNGKTALLIDGFIAVNSAEQMDADHARALADTREQAIRHYQESGTAFLRGLRGSFALALWDSSLKRLLLASDPFGTRSLYYTVVNGILYFAPRMSCLASRNQIAKEIDANSLYFYINHSFIPAPYTIYKNVNRLEPGHFLIWQRGEIRIERYWDMNYPEDRGMKESNAAELVASAVDDSVRFLLKRERVPVNQIGAFLSGGTDSSTITGLMTRISGHRIKTFSVGFDDEKYNEMAYARVATRHFDSIAHEYFVRPAEALKAVETIGQQYDEPFGNSSALPTYFCLKMARDAGIQTIFAGDGGDELFGGNERYCAEKMFWYYHDIPSAVRFITDCGAAILPRLYPFGKIKSYINKANLDAPARFFAYQLYYRDHASEFLSDDFRRQINVDFPLALPQQHYDRARESSRLNRLLYMDLKLAIGDNDLVKVNRIAESQGIQVRYPFLDKQVAMASGNLPSEFKLKGWHKRYIFKKAFSKLLPRQILKKKKHGFGSPTADWLRHNSGFRDLARSLLLDSRTVQRGYFKKIAVEDLLHKHDHESSGYYGAHIWNFMMLELWHRRHFDASIERRW